MILKILKVELEGEVHMAVKRVQFLLSSNVTFPFLSVRVLEEADHSSISNTFFFSAMRHFSCYALDVDVSV